jgi:hypothetical protein
MRTERIWVEVDGNKKNLMGYWCDQEEFDGKLLKTWWEQKDIDGNKRNLMGT